VDLNVGEGVAEPGRVKEYGLLCLGCACLCMGREVAKLLWPHGMFQQAMQTG
jgi:hypothetical protein